MVTYVVLVLSECFEEDQLVALTEVQYLFSSSLHFIATHVWSALMYQGHRGRTRHQCGTRGSVRVELQGSLYGPRAHLGHR